MARNTDREIKDFMIDYAIRSVLERNHCEVKHGRTIEDFVEYAKWVPIKRIGGCIDMEGMIVDYFTSDKEHYFEVVRKLESLKNQIKDNESAIANS